MILRSATALATPMKASTSSPENWCGVVVPRTASDSSLHATARTGLPLKVVPSPIRPTQRSRAIGWSITPSTGQPSCISAISVPKMGRPAMKLVVPSIGSSTHCRPAPSFRVPYSSPMMPSSARSLSRIARIAASAARSASVTKLRSAFCSCDHSPRNSGRIASPAASARRLASARSAAVAMLSRTAS